MCWRGAFVPQPHIKLITQLKSKDLKGALLLDLNVNRVKHGDLEATLSAISRVLSSEMAEIEVERLEDNSRALALTTKPDARKTNLNKGLPRTPCPILAIFRMGIWVRRELVPTYFDPPESIKTIACTVCYLHV